MAKNPCYGGPNPVTQDERVAIWKWAKANGIDAGMPFEQVHQAINDYFFSGRAKPEWINDILSGRKTPFRTVANDLWRKQYNRQVVTQLAADASKIANLGPVGKVVMAMRFLPRTAAVAGHGIVFPVTHGGDLLLRPSSWAQFVKGAVRTYRGAASSAYASRQLGEMKTTVVNSSLRKFISASDLYDLSLKGKLDVGEKSHPVGIISNTGKKTGFLGAAARSWDMLTVMRYRLWEKQMGKFLKPGMSEAEALDIGTHLAEWANHATGSGEGKIASIGGGTLFGPKLTQSKVNRLSSDPVQTAKTFSKMMIGSETTAGERAAAWTRLSGATQYALSSLGFLAVNQAVLSALGSKEKVNYTDPTRSDYFAFKGGGVAGYIPGMHTELRALAKVLNIAFMDSRIPGKRKALVENPDLRGETKISQIGKVAGLYGLAKLEPGISHATEALLGQNYQGRPLPWSKDPGTEKQPRMSKGEYFASIGPIPLEGPIGFVYDHLRKNGASATDSNAIIKGLIIFGGGLPGFHVTEQHDTTEPNATPSGR